MKRLALLLLPVMAVLLMSHNVSATARRLGNYYSYTSQGVSGLPSNGNIEHNKDYSLTATRDNYIYVANGRFVVSNFSYKENTKFYITLVQNFTATTSSVSKASISAEPFDIYNDYVYTINDAVSYNRSCANSLNCTITVMHNLELQGIGNGSGDLNSIGNLFATTGWTQTNSGTGVFNWTGYIFEDYDEWASFKSDLLNKLNSINSDTSDIVDTLGEINDKLDKLDSNADKDAEAWGNMQNTDGLIDVGDNTSFMDSFNGLNDFFGGLKNKTAGNCVVNANFEGRVNMGDINLCFMPDNIKSIVSTIAGVLFAIFDLLLVWSSIHYIVGLIDWSRRN